MYRFGYTLGTRMWYFSSFALQTPVLAEAMLPLPGTSPTAVGVAAAGVYGIVAFAADTLGAEASALAGPDGSPVTVEVSDGLSSDLQVAVSELWNMTSASMGRSWDTRDMASAWNGIQVGAWLQGAPHCPLWFWSV